MNNDDDNAVSSGYMIEFSNPTTGDTALVATVRGLRELGWSRSEASEQLRQQLEQLAGLASHKQPWPVVSHARPLRAAVATMAENVCNNIPISISCGRRGHCGRIETKKRIA